MAESISVYEVSPRDGLQNEPEVLSTDDKVGLIERLVDAGLTDIEVTSFVRPTWIPQLADAGDVVARLPRVDGVRYWGLVPNRKGLERALTVGLRHIATFMSVSETHNKKNVNRTRRESIAGLREVVATAGDEGAMVRSYLSTAFGCPYEGSVSVDEVVRLAQELVQAGADVIVLGDTTGMAVPPQVTRVIEACVQGGVGLDRLAVHLHDTRGTAVVNNYAAWQAGIRTFDAAVAGVGGCPYAPGAAGNAATEDLINLFEQMGVQTGVDLEGASAAGHYLSSVLGRQLGGRYHRFTLGSIEKAQVKTTA